MRATRYTQLFGSGPALARENDWSDLVDYVAAAREKGKYWIEGKEYAVADGDVLHFRFNV